MAIITGTCTCKCTYVISYIIYIFTYVIFTIILVHISTCTCTVCTVLNEYLDASQCHVYKMEWNLARQNQIHHYTIDIGDYVYGIGNGSREP